MISHITSALKVRSFFFLWLAELFSQIAFNMMNFILILVAFSLTNSSTAVSGIVLSFTVPAIIFGLLAGVYVDRWNKRQVLFITNAVRAVLLFALAFFHRNLIVLYTFSFAISIATQFFIPAETPMIPLLMKGEMLISANALFGLALYGSIFIAYALSGPFLILFGQRLAFLTLSLLFFIASICVLFIKLSPLHPTVKKRSLRGSLFAEVKEAFRVIFKKKDIYTSFFLLIILQILILIISVLGPGYARQILRIPINQFPLLFVTPATIGMVIGALLLTTYFHKVSKRTTSTIGLFVSAASILLLPYSSRVSSRPFVHAINAYLPHILKINILHLMVVLACIMGFALALIFVPANTIIQEQTSDEIRGKIYGTLNAVVAICSLFPVIMAGSLADMFGVGRVLTAVGLIIGAIAVVRLVVD